MKYTSTPGGRSFGRLLGLFAVALGLLFPAALQAQSGTGSITGRVLNVGNSKYLPNAVVTVEGTKLQALTDDLMGLGAFNVGNKAHAARVMLVAGVIKPLFRRSLRHRPSSPVPAKAIKLPAQAFLRT